MRFRFAARLQPTSDENKKKDASCRNNKKEEKKHFTIRLPRRRTWGHRSIMHNKSTRRGRF